MSNQSADSTENAKTTNSDVAKTATLIPKPVAISAVSTDNLNQVVDQLLEYLEKKWNAYDSNGYDEYYPPMLTLWMYWGESSMAQKQSHSYIRRISTLFIWVAI